MSDPRLQAIVAWAERDDDVRAVVLTGSAARDDGDALSDLDVELYVREPATLLASDEWFEHFGEVLVVERLPNPGWHPTRLVYYGTGKVDFTIAPLDALRNTVYVRPFCVLIDKDGAAGHLRFVPSPWTPPSAAEVGECWSFFWAAALMQAKSLVRGELWAARRRDADLKRELLRAIEWDHRARYGPDFDTWFDGKRMRTWMDAGVRRKLDACWSGWQPEAAAPALYASIDLFVTSLAGACAGTGHAVPGDAERLRAAVDAIIDLAPALRCERGVDA